MQYTLSSKTVVNVAAGLIGMLFERFTPQESFADELAALEAEWAAELEATDADEAVVADDLTQISGIGPTFARRLNEAGVHTYAQLARLTAEQAQELSGAKEWQADPADWIVQARQLS